MKQEPEESKLVAPLGTPLISSLSEDRLLTSLICIRDGKSMQEMCEIFGKSMGMIQRYCKFVENRGYVAKVINKGKKKMVHRSRYLTEKGKKYLKDQKIKTEKE